MVRPLSLTVWTLLSITLIMMIAAVLLFFNYSKHSTVKGQLLPINGQIRVISQQPGVVLAKYVREGQQLKKGDVLYKISSERYGENGAVFSKISQILEKERLSLIGENEKLQWLHSQERHTLSTKINSLREEISLLAEQLKSQQLLLSLTDNTLERYQGLMSKGYISQDQFQQRQSEQLGQVQVFQRLRREHTVLRQQLEERSTELSGLDSRQKNQLAQIERQLSMLAKEITESEIRREFVITAPEAGIATAVLAKVGHSVDARVPILIIIPTESHLEAEIYAPSKAIGFIQPGDPVNIRYAAYPYQNFGTQRGELISVSRTSISSFDLPNAVNQLQGPGETGEPLYRLRVKLDSQTINVYGKQQALQSGMLLEADILQESRRLYEWILEPLYSISGKVPE